MTQKSSILKNVVDMQESIINTHNYYRKVTNSINIAKYIGSLYSNSIGLLRFI